jgi:hypothetical protein
MGLGTLGKPSGRNQGAIGNTLRTLWELDGNTSGTRGKKFKSLSPPPSPFKKEKNLTVHHQFFCLG